ncbi:hypothetical protein EGR52_03160 [bacterium]|nr:hypothetical protein [bacterium]
MKNKLIIIFSIILIISCYMFSKKDNDDVFYELDNKISNNMLSMLLETSAGSGEYQETTASSWPMEGYVFNESLSKCEKGSSLSWDSTEKTVVMTGNLSDKCYVYFDKTSTLTEYVKAQYTGIQGENNLYYHNNSLTNGARDNSYRFAGPSDTTNNFVCFGYDFQDGTCPSDNLYRIIGVFGDEVKLIKYDYAKSTLLGTDGDYCNSYKDCKGSSRDGTSNGQNSKTEIGVYYWNNNTNNNTWSESRLNTINLNKNYINNIGTKWSEKISDHTWKVGGNTESNIRLKIATTLSSYNNANVTANNWMYMGLNEWTLAPETDYSYIAFFVFYNGLVNSSGVYNVGGNNITAVGVRPVHYLKSTIAYVSGSGTISSPILIS